MAALGFVGGYGVQNLVRERNGVSISQIRRPAAVRRSTAGRSIVSMASSADESKDKDVPFEIRGFSLGNVSVVLGFIVTGFSFYEYFSSSGVASTSSLGFVYGVPITLVGLALKYAELKPAPMTSIGDAKKLREEKATPILKKVINDVTRHRYGDEQHLDTALKAIGLIPRGSACPELLGLKEYMEDGEYCLALEFFSKETPYSLWEEKREKCERFFGPDVTASVAKTDAEKRLVELTLKTVSAAE